MGSSWSLYASNSDAISTGGDRQRIPCQYLLECCDCLERLSIKNVSLTYSHDPTEPVSQDLLINMVRNHPHAVGLGVILTPENIDMLQHERPEITFVSE